MPPCGGLAFPSLRTRAEPRLLQGSLGFALRPFYLLVGIEGTLDAYPVPWLRLGALYSMGVGFEVDGDQFVGGFAQYGEAAVGFRVWGKHSETATDLQLRRSVGGYGEALPGWLRPEKGAFADVVPVLLPSSHQVFVEGGALTGLAALQRCTANCDATSTVTTERQYTNASTQLLIPFAGLRYVYYSEAIMAKPRVNLVRYGQLFGHVLLHAFNAPSFEAYHVGQEPAARAALGMRVGGELPLSSLCVAALLGGVCGQGGASIGYTPYPAFVLLEFHVHFPIY